MIFNIFKRIANNALWGLLSLLITGIIILVVMYAYISLNLPNVAVLQDAHMQVPMRVLSADGKLIAQFGSMKRTPISINEVPKQMIQALLDTEDKRFYEHKGVDFMGMARAAIAVITSGRKVQGASTITMQVARNFFLTSKKTYGRKINEIFLALKIEQNFSKDKILELYLNKVFFGNRAYGIAAAAQVYYGKKPSELTLAEMAMLAGLPQAPSLDNPLVNPHGAIIRRNHVLERMLDNGDIDQKTYAEAIQQPVTARYHEQKIELNAPYISEMIRQEIIASYGDDAYQNGFTVITTIDPKAQQAANDALTKGLIAYSMRHGYKGPEQKLALKDQAQWLTQLQQIPTIANLVPAVVTAISGQTATVLQSTGVNATITWSGMQWARPRLANLNVGRKPQQASDILKVGDVIRVTQTKAGLQLSQIPTVQGALVSMDPATGAINALAGGFDFSLSSFNRATQALRQAGSSFKPFIYSAALDKGFTLASMINDAPIVISDSGENGFWRPNNDNDVFEGPTRLIVGLNQSRNLVSIRLLQKIGIPYAREYIQKFGFDIDTLPNSLSLALGTASLSPMSMLQGYGVFANGGYLVKPYYISKILDANNKVIFQANNQQAPDATAAQNTLPNNDNASAQTVGLNMAPEVITAQNAYLMNHAMQSVIQSGTGHAASVLKRNDLAGKTGTSSNEADAWFAGFNARDVAISWVGFDDQTSLREHGAQAALPIWIDFIGTLLQGTPEATMAQPDGIVNIKINPANGLLAYPGESDAIFEMFDSKYAPTTVSPVTTAANNSPTNTNNKSAAASDDADDDAGSDDNVFY